MTEEKPKAVIDSKFTFAKVPQAFQKLRTGHARGKIVTRVAENSLECFLARASSV